MVPRAAGLLPLGRRGPEQLGRELRRAGVGAVRRPLLLPRLPAPSSRTSNWRNPEVRAAMLDVLRFWCERGADGFRIDALRQLSRTTRGATTRPTRRSRRRRPVLGAAARVHRRPPRGPGRDPRHARRGRRRAAADRRALPADRAARRLLRLRPRHAGELPPADARRGSRARSPSSSSATRPRCPTARGRTGCSATTTARGVATRLGPGQERAAAFLLLTLRGTPTLYYGDELGMRDVEIAPERRVDPWVFGNRDPVRTPMQWDADGSFTEAAEPWLPFAPDHERVNVAAQRDDPGSLLSLYRDLLALRRTSPTSSPAPTGRSRPTTTSCASRAATRSRCGSTSPPATARSSSTARRSALGPSDPLSRQMLVTVRFAAGCGGKHPQHRGPSCPCSRRRGHAGLSSFSPARR